MTAQPRIAYNEITHTYSVAGRTLPSVTQILRGVGLIDDRWFGEQHAERGRVIHEVTRLHDEDDLDECTVDQVLRAYLDAWRDFRAVSGFVPQRIEVAFADTLHRFAGRIDRIGTFGGAAAILDIKSGAPQPSHALQLAGYDILAGDAGLRRICVHLSSDGKWAIREYKDRADRGAFLGAVSLYHWKQGSLR